MPLLIFDLIKKLALPVLVLIAILVLVATCTLTHAQDAVVGDSIALGTGRALHVPTQARTGAGSCEIARYATVRTPWTHLVISAGINDGGACVAALRAGVRSRRVIWIIPAPINQGAIAVWQQVKLYGDRWVIYSCRGACTKTNFHPASYAAVAASVKRSW